MKVYRMEPWIEMQHVSSRFDMKNSGFRDEALFVLVNISGCSSEENCSSVCLADLHHGQLSEYRLLLSEGGQGSSSDDPDRHVQLQQPQQQAAAQGLLADQGLL